MGLPTYSWLVDVSVRVLTWDWVLTRDGCLHATRRQAGCQMPPDTEYESQASHCRQSFRRSFLSAVGPDARASLVEPLIILGVPISVVDLDTVLLNIDDLSLDPFLKLVLCFHPLVQTQGPSGLICAAADIEGSAVIRNFSRSALESRHHVHVWDPKGARRCDEMSIHSFQWSSQ